MGGREERNGDNKGVAICTKEEEEGVARKIGGRREDGTSERERGAEGRWEIKGKEEERKERGER